MYRLLSKTSINLKNRDVYQNLCSSHYLQYILKPQKCLSTKQQQKCFDNCQHVEKKKKRSEKGLLACLWPTRCDCFLLRMCSHLPGPGAHPGDTAGSHYKQTGYSLCGRVAHKLKDENKKTSLSQNPLVFAALPSVPSSSTSSITFLHGIFFPSCSFLFSKDRQ